MVCGIVLGAILNTCSQTWKCHQPLPIVWLKFYLYVSFWVGSSTNKDLCSLISTIHTSLAKWGPATLYEQVYTFIQTYNRRICCRINNSLEMEDQQKPWLVCIPWPTFPVNVCFWVFQWSADSILHSVFGNTQIEWNNIMIHAQLAGSLLCQLQRDQLLFGWDVPQQSSSSPYKHTWGHSFHPN